MIPQIQPSDTGKVYQDEKYTIAWLECPQMGLFGHAPAEAIMVIQGDGFVYFHCNDHNDLHQSVLDWFRSHPEHYQRLLAY